MRSSLISTAAVAGVLASLASVAAPAADSGDNWIDGPFMLRARGVYVDPANRSDAFTVPCATGTCPAAPADAVHLDSKVLPELSAEWFLSPNVSTELALTVPARFAARLNTPAEPLGNLRMMPDTWTLKYDFEPDQAFRPYLGAGLHYTSLSSSSLATAPAGTSASVPLSVDSSRVGWVVQAGFDVRVARSWFLNADIRYLGRLNPQIQGPAGNLTDARINPLLIGVGIGYRFGGTEAAAPAAPAAPPAPPPAAPVAAVVPPAAPARPPLDSDGDGVPDSIDQCPNTPHGVRVDAVGCPCDIAQEVHFATDSATLTAEDRSALDALIPQLRNMNIVNGEIEGYTDSTGNKAHNKALSGRRARAVADYLSANGVGVGRLAVSGHGAESPVADNGTKEGRAHNRRVVIKRNDCNAGAAH